MATARRPTKVSAHQRNGKPVRGYVQHRSFGERVGSVLRGDEPGSVKRAMVSVGLTGAGLTVWYAASFVMTGAEATLFAISAVGAVLGLGSLWRRKHPTKYARRAIIFSPRARLDHTKARVVRGYRRKRDRYRKHHPMQAGLFDRYAGRYEVTRKRTVEVPGKKPGTKVKRREAQTMTVRGLKAKRAAMTAKSNDGWDVTSRQMFR